MTVGRTPGKRVLIAGLFHETHTFLSEPTPRSAFRFLHGDELLSVSGDASPLGGVLEFAQQRRWRVLPGVWGMAVPGGMVQDDVWDSYWKDLRDRIDEHLRSGIDAIYLVLHGAMVCESLTDVEGELLRRLRGIPELAELPIYGVLDLHANVSQTMIDLSDCLVAYRENPHADAREAAIRSAGMLDERLDAGPRLKQQLRQVAIVWPPTGTASATDPMNGLLRRAREIEASDPAIRCVNIIPGFAFADTPDTGLAITVIGMADNAGMTTVLDELEDLAWELAPLGVPLDLPLDDTLSRWRSSPPDGLTVIAEPSDNIGGGAPGDGTGLLRGLIRHEIENAAVCLNDPSAVAKLVGHASGARVKLALGGRGSDLDDGPLELTYELLGLYDGRFELEDKQSHLASVAGDRFDMGRCAVLRHHGITILLTSERTPPMDLGQWRCVGLAPESFALIGVKAAVAHRRAYDPITACNLTVATPGPCSSDLTNFPYRKLRRPIYPLDRVTR